MAMSMKSAAAEALKRQIEDAFAPVPYPGDDRLVSHPCDECEELAKSFKGQKWQEWKENPLGLMRPPKDQGVPFLFSTEAFRYYLPLVLLASVLHYEDANLIPGNLITAFQPAADDLRDHQKERINCLTKAQLLAVGACLRYLKQENGADFPGYDLEQAIGLVEASIQSKGS